MDDPLSHTAQTISLEADDWEWCERSLHWLQRGGTPKDKRVRRRPRHDPLVLTGHGVSLRIEAGRLLVRNGFTHYPQKQQTYRYFKGDADLPPRIIMLDGSGSVTFDVMTWLNEQKVPLVKIDWTGNVVTVVGGGGLLQVEIASLGRPRHDRTCASVWSFATPLLLGRLRAASRHWRRRFVVRIPGTEL